MEIIRWGIIATGGIAEKFCEALRYESARSGKSVLAAVASRDIEKARKFALRYGIQTSYGAYQDLLNDPAIDAVYIATPHNTHASLSLVALEAGKAVLCEKPVSIFAKDLFPVLEMARKKNSFYMEAMWMKCNPSFRKALEWVHEGRIGKPTYISADFFLDAPYDPKSRLYDPELGGGALLDVGIYPVTCAVMFAGRTKPSRLSAILDLNDDGVDLSDHVHCVWDSGIQADLASSITHKGVESVRSAAILGTKGSIYLPFFWMAQKAVLSGDDDTVAEVFSSPFECNGYEYEIREVEECLFSGKIESPVQTWADSIMVMELLDQIRKKQ